MTGPPAPVPPPVPGDAAGAVGTSPNGAPAGGVHDGGAVAGGATPDAPTAARGFEVHLEVFEGPFDLLLTLIAKHKLDVTEVALSQVTDEFLAYIAAAGTAWDLGQATEFLVVAATLLDLKAARLLPAGEVDDEEDIALLEARDLLFARLLQYRAYKQASAFMERLFAGEARRFARAVSLEPQFTAVVPDVLLGIGPIEFAALAARALTPREPPLVAVDHVHHVRVSVREQAVLLARRLSVMGNATFRALIADVSDTIVVVARFLALLELYREGDVAFDQIVPLGDLQIRWTGATAEAATGYARIEEYGDEDTPAGGDAAGEAVAAPDDSGAGPPAGGTPEARAAAPTGEAPHGVPGTPADRDRD